MNSNTPGQMSPITIYILLALSLRPRHGYELMQQIEQDTSGNVKLGAGTLYGSLKQLLKGNLIEEIPFPNDARRRQYRLTRKGWDILGSEFNQYARLVEIAKIRRVI